MFYHSRIEHFDIWAGKYFELNYLFSCAILESIDFAIRVASDDWQLPPTSSLG